MTRRARFLSSTHALDPTTGIVWARSLEGFASPAFQVNNSETEYGKLLVAAPLLYRAIHIALPMVETIGMIFEAHDMENHVGPLHNLEAGLNAAIMAATKKFDDK